MHGPLTGVRALDIATMFSGAFGASLLADFGADVIKIELPSSGDPVREMAPSKDGVSLPWTTLSRNKRSVTLDVRQPEGRALLLRLAAVSDVLIENFRPGTLDRWGLDYATLTSANPRLIVVRVSGYGQTGPYAAKAGFGTPATAFSGLTYLTGFPDRAPVNQPFPLADYVTGVFAALGAVMALYHRDTHGDDVGQEVDLALYESLFRLLESLVPAYDQLGSVPERRGNAMPIASPVGTFATRDGGWAVLTASTERTFQRFCEATGLTVLPQDPRFDSNAQRVRHNDELNELVQAWFAQHDRAEAIALIDAAGVPVSPINSIADIFADPHYQARQNLIEIEHPTLGALTLPGLVPKFSRTPGQLRHPGAPALGAYNGEVFGELLGMDAAELERLRGLGVV
jgi:formyl-CoA transferase